MLGRHRDGEWCVFDAWVMNMHVWQRKKEDKWTRDMPQLFYLH